MSAPYYADESVTLYHGDARDVLPGISRGLDEAHCEAAARRLEQASAQGALFGGAA